MAIATYGTALQVPDVPDALLLLMANQTIDRMRFKGQLINTACPNFKLRVSISFSSNIS